MNDQIYVDATYRSLIKYNEELCGDRVEIVKNDDRYIVVLSDGLGSGVKANILATLTSKIISTMMYEGASIEDTVETIVHTLPVCSVRKVAYSTFIILQVDYDGNAYLVEFDSPKCIFVRDGKLVNIDYKERIIAGKKIQEANFKVKADDVLTLLSDGVVYAGIGELMNLGWTWENVSEYVASRVKPEVTAARLTNMLSETCNQLYLNKPGDDTTVATVKIVPKKVVSLYSGPPVNPENDERLVTDFMIPEGKKIVCGGSSANIVSRVLKEPLIPSIEYIDPEVPPTAEIPSIDLVTEGVITLKKAVDIMKKYYEDPTNKAALMELDKLNGASLIAKTLIEECTHFNMFIGQKINPAHQNPDLPVDLSIKMIIMDELYSIMVKAGKVVKRRYY
ncbi:MAG: SpoIIE family protein phosphatase [Lachnospirales bacterium]